MDRAVWNRAMVVLRRVLGIGLSWALVWLAFGVILLPDSEALDLGKLARGALLSGSLPAIGFGVALSIAGRGRRASEISLARTLACAFVASGLTSYLQHRDLEVGLGLSVLGQFVTIVWYGAVSGWARARAARHVEPLMVIQVLIDFAVVLLACWLGFVTRGYLLFRPDTSLWENRGIILLTAAVTVTCFYACGLYRPLTRRIGREEVVAIALSTAIAFLAVFLLLVMLEAGETVHRERSVLLASPLSLVMAFVYLFALTTASRRAWFGVTCHMHRRGTGG